MKIITIGGAFAIAIFVLGCSAQKPAVNSTINPNGDSELALLMRAMNEDALRMKQDIAAGNTPTGHLDISRLRVADATEPAKRDSPEYQAYAQAYEMIYSQLQDGQNGTVEGYKSLVGTCTACHKSMCPGPLVRIEKLELPESIQGE